MNENSKKKRNTALFMLVATIINIVLMTVFMLVGYILLVRFANPDKPEAGQIWLIVIFIGSITLKPPVVAVLLSSTLPFVLISEEQKPSNKVLISSVTPVE